MKISITPSMPSSKGFTLVELMVTIVIGAILASIAIPGYTSQIRKSRRTEARMAVMDAAAREERFFATHNYYSQTDADLGYGNDTAPVVAAPVGSYYTLAVVCKATPCDATGFTVTASPIPTGPQSKDTTCTSFTVDQTGLQTAIPAANSTICWN
jgi:type IV pilus assembly protein PilE